VLQARKYQLDKSGIKGRPLFESVEEVAITLYAIEKSNNTSEVARIIGYEVPALWRVVQKIKTEGKVSYWDTKQSRIVTVTISYEDLLRIVEDLIKPKAKRIIPAVTDSTVIQEFIKNPERISKTGKVRIYTKREVRATVVKINEVAEYIAQGRASDIFSRYNAEPTNNPDSWASNKDVYEKILSETIDRICTEKYPSDQILFRHCGAVYRMMFRRVKAFRSWFEGEIGTVRRRVKPIPETLWYSDYIKLKEFLLSTGKREYRALWCVMALHIVTGAREGYASIYAELDRLEAKGVKVDIKLSDLDLDDPFVSTSLVGLKWDKVMVKDGRITSVEIYEAKTDKTWLLLGIWLDKDLEEYLLKVRDWALAQGIKSVVKSILLYEGVGNGRKWTVSRFENWYTDRVSWVVKYVLGKEITPHRLRSAHVSILAEFGVPLELVCSDAGFGVGWEDLSTAVKFYLRFSRQKVEDYFKLIEARRSST
jgi:hypothetical protein